MQIFGASPGSDRRMPTPAPVPRSGKRRLDFPGRPNRPAHFTSPLSLSIVIIIIIIIIIIKH
ncbi:hypothetical protein VP1G_11291 [Cytospora mali]|uniref:Uncharacterized protein n=1 Tax=Cytospora mali TaxID=578113 RepID=A0A194VCZ1_CYTMA|nr:hypothetical protein VP1G_11291 [Valsa mali var. pyri (nom. inval.)]